MDNLLKSGLVAERAVLSLAETEGHAFDSGQSRGKLAPIPGVSSAARVSSIVLVGASFKTCTLPFREALAERLSRDASRFRRKSGVREFAQLVTCNRIEVLLATDSETAEARFLSWLDKTPGMKSGFIYVYKDVDAIEHLFRVASGLDSMVLGEEQILSQVRDAGISARTSKSSRGTLSALFDAAVNVGARTREAFKAMGPSSATDDSVSSMALRFALDRLPRPPRDVLLIGTGKTTRLAASQLDGARLFVATRRESIPAFSRAKLVSHKDLGRVAARCDLIIAATKHQGYILKKGDLRGKKKLVILDLAFPRNIDPALNAGPVALYDLDDLAKTSASRPPSLGPEAKRLGHLVNAEAESFSRWLLASRQSKALSEIYRWAESTREEETAAALRRLPGLSERDRKVVQAMSKRLVSKLLAPHTSFAKSTSPELPQDRRLEVIQRIFEKGGK